MMHAKDNCGSWFFVASTRRSTICKSTSQSNANIYHKVISNPWKWSRNPSKNMKKNALGVSGAPVCPTSATRRTPDLEFATILAEKTDFGCHFGPQWILKGVTKSHCLTPCSKKNVKMTPKNDVKKHNELWSNNGANMRGFSMLKSSSRTILVAKYTFSGCRDFWWKRVLKWFQKWCQNQPWSAREHHF